MRALVALTFLAAGALFAQIDTVEVKLSWKPIEFLFGDWTATGGGAGTEANHSNGAGEFSFHPELNGQIVTRKNFAEYKNGEPRHDDLMIIYAETGQNTMRAIYFDSEGHTIRYIVKSPSANVVVFESEPAPGPTYKLVYELHGNQLDGKFEVGGRTYLTWSSVRK